MARPCQVCAHLERGEIDRRLSLQVCNVAALGREFGLHEKALSRHRTQHLPLFLKAFQAKADALTLDVIQAEAHRLYATTLDALARAEAGTLSNVTHVDKETGEETIECVTLVSHTAVARMIREARAGLTQLTALAADRGDETGRPSSGEDHALGAAIRAQLERVVARSTKPQLEEGEAGEQVFDVVEVVDQLGGDGEPDGAEDPGGWSGQTGGGTSGVGDPLDTDTPPETPEESQPQNPDDPESLSPEQIRVAAASIGVTPESFIARIRQARQTVIRNPNWEGNPAASEEERRAVGFGSIPVTDNRIQPDTKITPVQ